MYIRKKLLAVSVFLPVFLFSFISSPVSVSASSETVLNSNSTTNQKKQSAYVSVDESNQSNQQTETVFTYLDVFNEYYEEALNVKTEEGKGFISFDSFVSTYYSYGQKLGIVSYTDAWKNIDTTEEFVSSYSASPRRSTSSSSSNKDADYILNSKTYSYTPASIFKRAPVDKYDLTQYVRKGDIVYETNTKFWDCGHDAMVVKLDQPSKYGNFCETIEAVGGGVQYGFLDDQRIIDYGVKILRPRANSSQISEAVYFMTKQLGKKYSLDILRYNTSIDSTKWYCSELVWAAYYYAGVDICKVGGVYHGEPGNTGGPLPLTIYLSDNVYEVSLSRYFLRMYIVSKSGSTWKIRIKNPLPIDLDSVIYNTKMCFEDDARDWTHLSDLKTIRLSAYGYKDVEIKENWFADAVVCAQEKNDLYYITYGNQLILSSKRIMIKHSIKGMN